jgi:hypothetical protein
MQMYEFLSFLVIGPLLLLILRYVFDFPFPWDFRLKKMSPETAPSSQGLGQIFNNMADGYSAEIVMGNMNSTVVDTSHVTQTFKNALQNDVEITIINGPRIDRETSAFLELASNEKVKLFQHPTFPSDHFRVLINNDQKPIEVWVEEHHEPFHDEGYRYIKSSRVAKSYHLLFKQFLTKSTPSDVPNFQRT